MNHSFNTKIAEKFGVDGAIIIENLKFWIDKNKANKKHFYDNDYWTYNSTRAFTELFPYWTQRQIERILKNLEKEGAIKTGNYNKVGYDRTKWYGITQTVKSIYANGEMEITKHVNGITQTVGPIPYINTDIKTNIKTYNYEEIIEVWNSNKKLPFIRSLSQKRKDKIKLRINEVGEEEFKTAITKLNDSDFATGKNDKNWKATIDWLVENDNNIVKVLEGRYDNKDNSTENKKELTEEQKILKKRLELTRKEILGG